ncbi:MAG: aldolase catalytic domain-containing protein [Spirochaetales bacterium]|nr:aldolase catalytic domain-containing protein [Spirochaetales bacterium]
MEEKIASQQLDKNIKGWIGYRPRIKVFDCTIRDGGLMNDHKFDVKIVRSVYDALVAGGIDYMEVGYKSSKKIFTTDKFGSWKYSDEEEIRKLFGEREAGIKISVMADAERTDYRTDILTKSESAIDMIRVATYIHQIPTALDMIKDAHDKGYETTVNLMAISTVPENEIDAALEALAGSEVEVIYLVDSFGSLYLEQVQNLTRKYLSYAEPAGKQVGIHAHNNTQLAYANTITALIEGANFLDATLDGMGRGAGNCALELLIGFLHNPKFHVRPLLKCLQENIYRLKTELNWGYQIPYMITGQLNQHPRAAINFLKSDKRENLVDFYDQIIEEQ